MNRSKLSAILIVVSLIIITTISFAVMMKTTTKCADCDNIKTEVFVNGEKVTIFYIDNNTLPNIFFKHNSEQWAIEYEDKNGSFNTVYVESLDEIKDMLNQPDRDISQKQIEKANHIVECIDDECVRGWKK